MSNETNARPALLETLNGIKASVRAAATKKKGKPLTELVDMILDALQEHAILFTWDTSDSWSDHQGERLYVYSAIMHFRFIDVLTNAEHTIKWDVVGSGETVEQSFNNAYLGAKERFLLYYFDVPEKDLDPAKIIKKERFELEEARQKQLQKTLDKMHAKIRERVLADQEAQRAVDEIVKGYVRVNGKPSTNYYEIKTLETAEALSRAIDSLFA